MADVLQIEPPTKRQKTELTKTEEEASDLKRKTCLGLVKHWYLLMEETYAVEPGDLYSQELLIRAMTSSYKLWRQEINGSGVSTTRETYLTTSVTIGNVSKALREFMNVLKKLITLYEFPADWAGIITPCLTHFSIFKYRMEELRFGHCHIPESSSRSTHIHKYNLRPIHSGLLEGIRWPPIIRSSWPGSVGPLTQMICLRRVRTRNIGSNIDFSRKWQVALRDSIGHIPQCDEIIKLACTVSDEEFGSLIRAVGDVLLFTGGGQQQKVALPIEAILQRNDDLAALITAQAAGIPLSRITLPDLSISGKKAVMAYNGMVKIKMPKIKDVDTTKQVFFHCVFGTYKDNLNLLSWMTSHKDKWHNRIAMWEDLVGTANKEKIEINPIKVEFYSDMSSGNQSPFFRNRSQQYIEEGSSSTNTIASRLNTVIQTLKLQFNEMYKRIKEDGMMKWGTQPWVVIEDYTNAPVANPPLMAERFFFGPEDDSSV